MKRSVGLLIGKSAIRASVAVVRSGPDHAKIAREIENSRAAGNRRSEILARAGLDSAKVIWDLVDDPEGDPGEKIELPRSIINDPLGAMFKRGQIDQAQFEAGKDWQKYYEAAEISGARAIDTTREAVDGGRFKEPEIDNRSRAMKKMKEAHIELGPYGWSLVFDVLARHMTIIDIAKSRNMSRQRELDYLACRFRECLESLAKLWKYA